MDLQTLQDVETVADVAALYEATQLVCDLATVAAIDRAYEAILNEE